MSDNKERDEAAAQFSILALAQHMCNEREGDKEKVDVHMSILTGDVLGLEKPEDAACMVLCLYTESLESFQKMMREGTLRDLYFDVRAAHEVKVIETDVTEQ